MTDIFSSVSSMQRERAWWIVAKRKGCPLKEPSVLGTYDSVKQSTGAQVWLAEHDLQITKEEIEAAIAEQLATE